MLWFFLKTLGFIFFFVWLRGTLPRMRYDQFMDFGWKVLIPVSLAWIMAVGVIHKLDREGMLDRQTSDLDLRRAGRAAPAVVVLADQEGARART